MNNSKPLVSIIIPTYNRVDITIATSIPSVLNQTYTNWELLIIDDGSTDNTKEVCKQLTEKDQRIKYFYEENKGQGAARNLGIKEARGNYVLLLDSDDALLPDMITTIIKIIIDNNYDYVTCKRWVFNYSKGIFDINISNPSCAIYKKCLFEKLGYFDENNNIRGVEDTDLFISWEINKKIKNIKIKNKNILEPLVVYLEHTNQETSHSNIERIKKLNEKTIIIIDKYKNNKYISKKELSLRYKESGNFDLLLKDKKNGRKKLIKSLKIKFNTQAIGLLFFSFFNNNFYKNFVDKFKLFREKKIWKIRLDKAIKKYSDLYNQAIKITSTYKNW